MKTAKMTMPANAVQKRSEIVKLEHVICVGRICLRSICQEGANENATNAGKCEPVNAVLKNGLSSYRWGGRAPNYTQMKLSHEMKMNVRKTRRVHSDDLWTASVVLKFVFLLGLYSNVLLPENRMMWPQLKSIQRILFVQRKMQFPVRWTATQDAHNKMNK